MTAPRSIFVEANRLRLHLVDWSRPGAGGEPVLLLHGLQEHARAWDFVAPRLAEGGRRVLALDWRGHGESERVGRGGYYHFADYVADLAFLVREFGGRAALVGHSMGGSAALLYAGSEPERVSALVLVEGLGPPDADPAHTAERWGAWVGELEALGTPRERDPSRPAMTLDSATRRLAARFPLWSPEVVRHMALHGTREAAPTGGDDAGMAHADATSAASGGLPEEDRARAEGGKPDEHAPREWRFDPLHRTRSPQPYYVAQARSFWKRVACPVLYVEGTRSWISAAPIEIDARVRELGAARSTIEGAAHHPQLERPEETAKAIGDFLAARGAG